MNDDEVSDAMRRLLVVHEQDQCADGYHDYTHRVPGIGMTCRCGKAERLPPWKGYTP